MITVGDQIFALTQEVKQLKKQCQRYETVLQDIASTSNANASQNAASLAREVLIAPPQENRASS